MPETEEELAEIFWNLDRPRRQADTTVEEAPEFTSNRRCAFRTEFAYPVTADDMEDRKCLTCRSPNGPLFRTYFENSIPAFMCVPCIEASLERANKWLDKWKESQK